MAAAPYPYLYSEDLPQYLHKGSGLAALLKTYI